MPPAAGPPLLALLGATAGTAVGPGTDVDFERDVRPILVAHCVACHGPKKHEGGVRFDSAAGARDAPAPGDPAQSARIVRVTATDDDQRMPQDADPLGVADVETLRAWIAAGAAWPAGGDAPPARSSHRAYQPVTRPVPPDLAEDAGVRSPIDRLVRARLEAVGLAASPEAELPTLARRVALDLTGLPPTPEDVDALLADARPDAYERYVDRLLATRAYAERRTQTWPDLARYADTNGYEKDDRRVAWRWRDRVVDAYARNLPFDGFPVKQLAGDLLPDATLDDRIATGFHRDTLVNQGDGTDPEEFRVAAVVDRVNTTAAVWLGTTLACAQCHAHEFDPFTQEDYYRFFAFFDSTEDVGNSLDPRLPAPTAAQSAEIVTSLPARCRECEPASAALIEDLTERGLLDDTLVVWGGEFGRTPMNEERDGSKLLGRDHHPHAFSVLLAGGGVRPGITLGATDDFGYRVTEDPVSLHDLHATLLHQPGYDHEKLTFRSQGRDFRLTDVEGEVVRKLLA